MSSPAVRDLASGAIVRGPLFPEPIDVITTIPMGDSLKVFSQRKLSVVTPDSGGSPKPSDESAGSMACSAGRRD